MFFSLKAKAVRKQPSNAFHRRLILEPLESRRLLTVILGKPSPATWIYGQTELVGAMVTDNVTGQPPLQGTEVDLVNAGASTAAPSPILVKGSTYDGNGDVNFNLSGLNVGAYNLVAEFTDSGGNLEMSSTQPVTVTPAATTTTLTSSADGQSSVPFSQPVVFKAAVEDVSPGSAIPDGWVTFEDVSTATPTILGKARIAWNSNIATSNSGVATLIDSSLPVGTHSVVAYYQGDRDFTVSDNSAAPDNVVVANAATTTFVSAGPNPAVYGQDAVTLTATVVPAFLPPGPTPIPLGGVPPGSASATPAMPTGSVQFAYTIHGSTTPTVLLGTAPLVDGEAQLTLTSTTLPVNTDDITATYLPDATSKFQTSTSPAYSEVVVSAAATIATTTTVTPPSQTIVAGSEASFTINVAPATGTVPGSDKVYMYDVGAVAGPSTSSANIKTLLGMAAYVPANSDWTFTTTTPLAPGFHTIEAYFAGDATFAPSWSQPVLVTVTPKTITQVVVTAAPNPAAYGATVTLTATVLPVYFGPVTTLPTGSVQFAYTPHGSLAPTILLGTAPLIDGQAVLQVPSATPAIAPLRAGIDDIIATYLPATPVSGVGFAGNSSQPFSEVILPVSGSTPTTTTVMPPSQTIAAGKEASFTIAVATSAALPVATTGPVYLFDDGAPTSSSGNPATGVFLGTATYESASSDWTFTTVTPPPVGIHEIEAVFAGDNTYASSDGFATVSVLATPTPLPPIPVDPFAPAAVAPTVQMAPGNLE